MTSGLSEFIVYLLVLFLAVGSVVLLWDGLASGALRHGHHGTVLHDPEHPLARFVTGIVGFAVAAWVLLSLLGRAG